MVDNFNKYDLQNVYERKSIWEQLEAWALKYNHRIAITNGKIEISYYQLKEKSQNLADEFYCKGMRYGDNVAVQLPNVIEFFLVCFALWRLGARPVLLLPSHREAEIQAVFQVIKPSAYIFPKAFLGFSYDMMANSIAAKCDYLKFIWDIDLSKNSTEIGANHDNNQELVYPQAKYSDVALFLLSGGTTTGIPKLIPKIHAAYIYNAKMSCRRCDINSETVLLEVLPVSHDFPLSSPGALGTFYMGGKVVLAKTSSCDEAFDLIEQERVTNMSLVPAIAEIWLDAVKMDIRADFSTVKSIIIGASKLEKSTAASLIKEFDCTLQQGYGLGEGITCFTSLQDPNEVIISTQGKPVSELDEVRIVNETGNDVAKGEYGELIERGPYTFNGYYQAESINKEQFTAEGYFRTGDCAAFTDDGNIVIKGRMVETINKAGEKVLPSELEGYIAQYPGIREAAVVSVEDQFKEPRIVAFVTGAEQDTKIMDINKFLGAKGIAAYKMLDQLMIVDEFPRVNVGKVDKRTLKRMVEKDEKQSL